MHVTAGHCAPGEARAAIAAIARTDDLMRWAARFAERPVKVILMPVRSRDGDCNVPWHVHDVLSLSHGTCQPATAMAIDILQQYAGQGDVSPFEAGSASGRAALMTDAAWDRDIADGDALLRRIGHPLVADALLSERRSRGKRQAIYAPRTAKKWGELLAASAKLDPAFASLPDGKMVTTAHGDGRWSSTISGRTIDVCAQTRADMDEIASAAPRCRHETDINPTMRAVISVTANLRRASVAAFLAERAGRDRL